MTQQGLTCGKTNHTSLRLNQETEYQQYFTQLHCFNSYDYQTDLFDPYMHYSSWVRMNLGMIAMSDFKINKAPELEPHHQMQFSVISRTLNDKVAISII